MTDTAAFADIVLPSTTQLEHFDAQGAWGHHYISVNHPAIEPLGEAKSHGEILRLLARGMNLTHPALHETDEQIAAAALPADVDLAALKVAGWMKRSPARPVPGASAKLRLCGGVPTPTSAPASTMMQLLTPKGHFFLNSSFANMVRQRRSMKRPLLEMGREDAAMRGLVDGQFVEIRGDRGSLRVQLAVIDGIHHGVVALPGKWWNADVGSGAAVNDLTAPVWSPAGQPAYNEIFVEVLSVS
jgi:anaerobic selenocysteine-containing dehydrogenase